MQSRSKPTACGFPERSFVICALLLSTTHATAATDGFLGTSSEGTSVITIVKQDAVQISDVDDLYLGVMGTLTSNKVVGDDVCVFSSTGAYSLTASSVNGSFALMDSNASTDIPYVLQWVTSTVRTVNYGSALTNITGESRSLNCNGSSNARFQVVIVPDDFNEAEPGSYRDTLTLLVQPE